MSCGLRRTCDVCGEHVEVASEAEHTPGWMLLTVSDHAARPTKVIDLCQLHAAELNALLEPRKQVAR